MRCIMSDPEWKILGEDGDVQPRLLLEWRDKKARRHTRYVAVMYEQAGHPEMAMAFLKLLVRHLNGRVEVAGETEAILQRAAS